MKNLKEIIQDFLLTEQAFKRAVSIEKIRNVSATTCFHFIEAITTTNKQLFNGWIHEISMRLFEISETNLNLKPKKNFSSNVYFNALFDERFQFKNHDINYNLIEKYYKLIKNKNSKLIQNNINIVILSDYLKNLYITISLDLSKNKIYDFEELETLVLEIRQKMNINF